MSYGESARSRSRRAPSILVAGLLVAVAAIAVVRAQPTSGPSSTEMTPAGNATVTPASVERPAGTPADPPPGPLGPDDGAVPDGAGVFDDAVPGVARLDPDLRDALRRAATDAAAIGVGFEVDSGWRSAAYQEQLLRDAIATYGSEAEAARWVATPETSAHVSGDAVDIGPPGAAAWLSEHGSDHGLCQVYANESWHFELRPAARDLGCPPMYADPTHDPRMS